MLISTRSNKWQYNVSANGNHLNWQIYRMNSSQRRTRAERTPLFTCLSNTRTNNETINQTYISYLQKDILYSLLCLHQMSNSMFLFKHKLKLVHLLI